MSPRLGKSPSTIVYHLLHNHNRDRNFATCKQGALPATIEEVLPAALLVIVNASGVIQTSQLDLPIAHAHGKSWLGIGRRAVHDGSITHAEA
jgi:hypothetical protein